MIITYFCGRNNNQPDSVNNLLTGNDYIKHIS